jgi:hypothetical protein
VLLTHPLIVWSAAGRQLSRAARRLVDLHLGLGLIAGQSPFAIRHPPSAAECEAGPRAPLSESTPLHCAYQICVYTKSHRIECTRPLLPQPINFPNYIPSKTRPLIRVADTYHISGLHDALCVLLAGSIFPELSSPQASQQQRNWATGVRKRTARIHEDVIHT